MTAADRLPPAGVRTTPAERPGATRIVLVRHGQAVCNVEGVVGGRRGCTGLTALGVAQVRSLAGRLARTGELSGTAAVYASPLPRAVQTAELLVPALDRWREGPPLGIDVDCDLCELHPGLADGLTWAEFSARYDDPDWDAAPDRPLAPEAESWTGFVDRASTAVARLAAAHPGQLVVVACHAGVIESTLLRFPPVDPAVTRLGWPTRHASMTLWEREEGTTGRHGRWRLQRYNDTASEDGPD